VKVEKLIIENIASLRNKHIIDFNDFLSDTQLFAITGDTGAGKSTILNCITLALYGKHYKKNIIHYDMVTLGEREGHVELFFEAKNKRYKAVFKSTVRKSNGEYLKKPKSFRELYILNDGKEEITEQSPEEILNLTFDQFSKTVILNQGMFAEFLTSDFKERKEIIEKLYKGEKLNQLNPKLREKINQTIREIENLESKLSGLMTSEGEILNEKEILELKLKVESAKVKHQNFQQAINKVKDLSKLREDFYKTRSREKETKTQLETSINKFNQANVKLDELERKIENFNEHYESQLNLLIKASNYDEENKKIKKKRLELEKEAQESSSKRKKLNQQKSDFQERINEIKLKLKELNIPSDKKIAVEEINKYKDILDQYKTHTHKETLIIQEIKYISEQKSEYHKKIDELSKKEKTQKLQIDELSKKLNETPLAHLEKQNIELNKLLLTKEESDKFIFSHQQQLKQDRDKVSQIEADIKKIKNENNKLEQDKIETTKLIDYEKLVLAQNQCIDVSNHHSKCVVCDTPLSKQLQFHDSKDIDNYISRLESIQNNLNENITQEKVSKNNLIQLKSKINENLMKIKEKQANIESSAVKALGHIAKGNNQLDVNSLLDENIKLLDKTKRIDKKYEQLKTEHSVILQSLKESQHSIENFDKKLEVISNDHEKIKMKLKDLQNSSIFELKDLSDILKINQDFLQDNNLLNQIKKEAQYTTRLLDELNENSKKINLTKAELDKQYLEGLSFIKEHCGDFSPNIQLEKLKDEKQKLERSKKDLLKIKNELADDKTTFETRLSNLKDQYKDLQKLFNSTLALLDDSLNFSPWKEYGLLDLSIDTNDLIFKTLASKITLQGESAQNSYQELYDKYLREKTVFDQNKAKEDEINKIKNKIKHLSNELSEWEELYALIGKDEFRNYILAIVEKNLIKQTNFELEKLCDSRYQIEHLNKNNKSSQDFYIKDRLNANELRKVSTLSGGETFMVSLAMALALAELSRGEAELDSFFIDEGFGTLDQDSLEDVFNLLNDMQSNGKQIGLISHIKDLTQRIPININLSKNRLGNSDINILMN
jgi:exonuclease SbcC